MGYYTKHTLRTEPSNGEVISKLREEYENARYAINEYGGCYDSTKWYSYNKDLKEFSKQFPDILFILHGDGEENGDLWNAYYKNGKAYTAAAEIVYPEFDENKLI